MAGLIFFKTGDLELVRKFYIERMGMELWHDQGMCIILRHGNLLLGFCQGERDAGEPCITFLYESQGLVDEAYAQLKDIATTDPALNVRFNIYHFWGKDPEGRTLEFQVFLDEHLRI